MRCLWVSGDVPHPPTHGKFVYSAGLSEALAGAGVEVVGVGLEHRVRPVATRRPRVSWHAIAATRRGRLASIRRACRAWRSRRHRCATPCAHCSPAAVGTPSWSTTSRPAGSPISVPPAGHRSSTSRTTTRAACGSAVAAQSDDRLDRRAALRLEAEKARRLERGSSRRAALVVAITDSDAARFAADAPGASIIVLTPGYRGASRHDAHDRRRDAASGDHRHEPRLAREAGEPRRLRRRRRPDLRRGRRHARRRGRGAVRARDQNRALDDGATTLLGRVDDLEALLDRDARRDRRRAARRRIQVEGPRLRLQPGPDRGAGRFDRGSAAAATAPTSSCSTTRARWRRGSWQ